LRWATGFVPTLLAATGRRPPASAPVAGAEVRAVRAAAEELGLPSGVDVGDLKIGIADVLSQAEDEAVRRVFARLAPDLKWAGRLHGVTTILRRLGPP